MTRRLFVEDPETLERRARVLKYPDLAARLCLPPLRLKDPEQWTGYVPPRLLPEESCPACDRLGRNEKPRCDGIGHLSRVNDSPFRRQVVEIATEAMQRERTESQETPRREETAHVHVEE